ncbi:MAG: cytochrome c oxidase subunit II [Nocardioidaceae bacterium]
MSRTLTERVAGRRTRRRAATSVVGVLVLVVLTGCSKDTTEQMKRLGLPEASSDRSEAMSSLWIGSWIACLVTGVVVWGLIAYCAIRFRRRRDDEIPRQLRYHLPIEMLYTVAPLIVVAVFFFFTVEKQDDVLADVPHPDHQVLVSAGQWSWTFNYLEESVTGGTNVYDQGTPAHQPELWLVKDQSVNFELRSPDVIHSFWVPSFYFKMDVIPGRQNSFSMTPTKLGVFQGRCAELCGVYHSEMLFQVHVVSQDQFESHLRALKAAGDTGLVLGGENSRVVSGSESGSKGSAP